MHYYSLFITTNISQGSSANCHSVHQNQPVIIRKFIRSWTKHQFISYTLFMLLSITSMQCCFFKSCLLQNTSHYYQAQLHHQGINTHTRARAQARLHTCYMNTNILQIFNFFSIAFSRLQNKPMLRPKMHNTHDRTYYMQLLSNNTTVKLTIISTCSGIMRNHSKNDTKNGKTGRKDGTTNLLFTHLKCQNWLQNCEKKLWKKSWLKNQTCLFLQTIQVLKLSLSTFLLTIKGPFI
jgi:hypothetical protein